MTIQSYDGPPQNFYGLLGNYNSCPPHLYVITFWVVGMKGHENSEEVHRNFEQPFAASHRRMAAIFSISAELVYFSFQQPLYICVSLSKNTLD